MKEASNRLQVHEVAEDIHVFVGADMLSVATAFIDGDSALLVDTMASRDDAFALHLRLCGHMGKKVRKVVVSHYMDDHLAGLPLFGGAEVIAHEMYMHTYFSQGDRQAWADADFVHPTTLVGSGASIRWGRHALRVFHNPGHTVSTLNIDVPASDLVITADNHVGHIAYLSSSAPSLMDAALGRIEQLRRGIHVPGHIGPQGPGAVRDARTYLRRLGERVRQVRGAESISVEECAVPGRQLTAFEREWHERNLRVIAARNLFPPGPAGDLEAPAR